MLTFCYTSTICYRWFPPLFFSIVPLWLLCQNQVFIGVWMNVRVFDLIPLVHVSVFMSIPSCYVLIHKQILDVKQKITRLQSIVPEKLGNKEDLNRDTWITLGRGIRWDLLGKLKVRGGYEGEGKGHENTKELNCWGGAPWSERVMKEIAIQRVIMGLREKPPARETLKSPQGWPQPRLLTTVRGCVKWPSPVIRLMKTPSIMIEL